MASCLTETNLLNVGREFGDSSGDELSLVIRQISKGNDPLDTVGLSRKW
jgi:hypothetical protein